MPVISSEDALTGSPGERINHFMNNIKIRITMMEHNLKQWQLAKLLDVSESTVNRLLREELPEEEQDRIVEIIKNGGITND